uniref:F-actin-uncapping protein LRRC16A-like n=1 Tax=Doryrhamphus excisus TaxID=161450 RepID=UPI0025AE09AE|nr:F-actin-uncapping protein LRRC16A-like [Doryrhamphus excisus]
MDQPELFESVRDAVGRGVKLTLRRKVQLEVKGEKVENKVLALASHRAFLLSARVPSKVEQSLSYLDIQGIHSNKATQVVLECERGPWTLWLSSLEEVDEVIAHVGFCLLRICPAMKLMKKVSVKPPERAATLRAIWEQQGPLDLGPCGGFSHQYRCVCEHLNLPYRDEVQWDVDTIYLSQDTRELNLQDFSHLDSRDLVAIVGVLEFNQWFTKLVSKDVKLSTDVCEQILRVVSRSGRLEELVLDNAGLKSDFAHRMSLALSHNPASSLHTLILSNNALEDKGMCLLSGQLTKLATGLKQLNLSRNSLSPKGINFLCQALCVNPSMAATLTHLELSGNSLRGDDLQNLHNFLSHDNHLQLLDLSCSDCSLEQTSASLLKGCLKHLSVLNMSKTVFSHRKCKEVPPSFKQFFSSSLALTAVNVSGTRLPAEALKALLLGLGCNPNLSDVSLDLSSCELRSAGSQILEGCIAEIPNIASLDISDNGLDGDLSTLLVWLAKNRSVRHLSLGRNFQNIKSKNVAPVLDNLVHMIQEEESPLTSLSLADSKLKGELTIVLNALGSNASLTKLDISGNAMGDMGAKMLAKALQINTKLRTLIWDRNNANPQGLQEVASALEKNFTIRFMPIPIVDAAQALKINPEKTEDALLKMERFLLRNHETRKYLQEQAYRLQQGIVTSTTQQMMDTMCVKVQDHLNSLMFSQSHVIQDDMKVAENLMNDARNSKTLLPSLYHVKSGALHGAIQDKLKSLAGEVAATMEDELQMMLASMLDAAEDLCPHVIKRSGLRQELLRAGAERMIVPRSFVTATLLEQSGVDIVNKISEVKLSAASFVSDRIVDEILDSLSTWQHTLAEHVTRKGQPVLRPESQETEVLDEMVLQPERLEEEGDRQLEDADTGLMMAQSKRKSILVRMLRPVSVAFEMEFDLDKALEEVPIHVVDPPPSQPEKMPSSTPALEELPHMEHQTLQHHTKVRPRPKKRNKPSRVAHVAASSAPQGAEHQGIMAKVDEGVDEFFSKNIMKVSFKRPVAQVVPASTQEAPEKKRESRRSGFFNLIKSRTSRSEKSQGTASISPPPPVSPTFVPPLSSVSKELPPMSPGALHRDDSYSDTDASPGPAGVAKKEEGEKEDSMESDHPVVPRHLGIPVMASDLLAEMKARQEKMVAQKPSSKEDGHLDVSQPGPVAAPRSKTPTVNPKAAPPQLCKTPLEEQEVLRTNFLSENSTPEALKGPIPAPRLKRLPSAPEPECHDGVSASSGDVLDLPASRSDPGGGDRAWSSLKRCARPPWRCEEERERAKSLPADVRNPQAPSGRRRSGEEGPTSADNQSEAAPDDGVDQA